MERNSKKILIAILVITAFLRLFLINFPNGYVFDEVYHAFTAKEMLAGHKEAWEWWNTPPPGVAYEWTHPPLAKEAMVASMFILRTTDGWAWRLPGVLLGVFCVYLVYLLGVKLINEKAGLIAAFVFSLDGLNFVQSRTGMNDTYVVTFILLTFLSLLHKRFFLSAICLGLALSSKWAAVYLFLPVMIILIKDRQFLKIPYFLFIPVLVYLISYTPFFLTGHNFERFIELQKQMWWYHTGLKATHGYSSPWWSWPLNLYPVWYFVDYQKNNIANIFASGNPAVFWIGAVAVLLTVWDAVKRRSANLMIILLGFFTFWLPWSVSPRIMFLYHYSPCVPFLALALGYQFSHGLQDRESRKLVILLLTLMVLSFIFVYPFLVGIPIPKEFVKIFFSTNLTKNPFGN